MRPFSLAVPDPEQSCTGPHSGHGASVLWLVVIFNLSVVSAFLQENHSADQWLQLPGVAIELMHWPAAEGCN